MDAVHCLVIGGGAAGMMAAVAAAGRGEGVVLLEGNRQLGRKILVSGNGRCNLTNLDADSLRHYHGGDPGFVGSALAQFPTARTLAFFAELGIETHEEKRGRLFPRSDQAQSVVEVLEDRLQVLGASVTREARVVSLTCSGDLPGKRLTRRSAGPRASCGTSTALRLRTVNPETPYAVNSRSSVSTAGGRPAVGARTSATTLTPCIRCTWTSGLSSGTRPG